MLVVAMFLVVDGIYMSRELVTCDVDNIDLFCNLVVDLCSSLFDFA